CTRGRRAVTRSRGVCRCDNGRRKVGRCCWLPGKPRSTRIPAAIVPGRSARDCAIRGVYRCVSGGKVTLGGRRATQDSSLVRLKYLELLQNPADFRGWEHFFARLLPEPFRYFIREILRNRLDQVGSFFEGHDSSPEAFLLGLGMCLQKPASGVTMSHQT